MTDSIAARVAAAFVAACGGAPAAPVEVGNATTAPATRPMSACPYFGPDDNIVPWAHELFPGCPKPPFEVRFPVCVRECPHPCRGASEEYRYAYTYDAHGRWIATHDRGKPFAAATYAGEHLATAGAGRELAFHYDDQGRLSGVTSPTYNASYHYAGNGDLVSIADEDQTDEGLSMAATFVYSDHHLVKQHDLNQTTIDYHYEGNRVVASDEDEHPIERTKFNYDERGRLRSTERVTVPNDPSYVPLTWTFDYDDRDRLIRQDNSTAVGHFITTYEYCD